MDRKARHMDAFRIRDCSMEDAEAIWQINQDAFGYAFDAEKTKERLAFILSCPFYRVFAAESDRRAIGYIHCSSYDCTYDEPLKNILALGILTPYRGKGIGRALIAAAENWAKSDGAAGIRLVSGFNRTGAHRFYEACGYDHRKDQKNYMKRF